MRITLYFAIGFFIALNLLLIVFIFQRVGSPVQVRLTDQEEAAQIRQAPQTEHAQVGDRIFVQSLQGHAQKTDDALRYEGVVRVVNEQGVGAGDAVVTLQLVQRGEGEIQQVLTDENGEAAFSYTIEPGNWRIEVIDVTGGGYDYAREQDAHQDIRGNEEGIITP